MTPLPPSLPPSPFWVVEELCHLFLLPFPVAFIHIIMIIITINKIVNSTNKHSPYLSPTLHLDHVPPRHGLFNGLRYGNR